MGLRETLKVERRAVFDETRGLVAEYQQTSAPSEDEAQDIATRVLGIVDRYRAVLLPLIEHEPEAFAHEVETLAGLASTKFMDSGLTGWIEFPQWPAWLLVNGCGAFAVENGHLAAAGYLLREPVPERRRMNTRLGLIFPGEAAQVVAANVLKQAGITNRAAPWYDLLVRSLGESELP